MHKTHHEHQVPLSRNLAARIRHGLLCAAGAGLKALQVCAELPLRGIAKRHRKFAAQSPVYCMRCFRLEVANTSICRSRGLRCFCPNAGRSATPTTLPADPICSACILKLSKSSKRANHSPRTESAVAAADSCLSSRIGPAALAS